MLRSWIFRDQAASLPHCTYSAEPASVYLRADWSQTTCTLAPHGMYATLTLHHADEAVLVCCALSIQVDRDGEARGRADLDAKNYKGPFSFMNRARRRRQ
jgi:hypothetical protein